METPSSVASGDVEQDKNVEAVRDKLRIRSQRGLQKYGVSTERRVVCKLCVQAEGEKR